MKNDIRTFKVGDKLIDTKRREFTITRIDVVDVEPEPYKRYITDRKPIWPSLGEDFFCENDAVWSEYQAILALSQDPKKKRFVVTYAGGYPLISDGYDETEDDDYRHYAYIKQGEISWIGDAYKELRPHELEEINKLVERYKSCNLGYDEVHDLGIH